MTDDGTDRGKSAVVVCLDDEPQILSALRRLLRNEPYEFLATDRPDVALTWVVERRAELVIADQRMPGISGLEVLETVRLCSPETVRVMLTAHSDLSEVLQVRGIDAIERLVRKPWDGEELKRTLRLLLATRSGDRRPAGPLS
jgi:response regulator RpfG family c-di-GMP phosphodiesterase